MEGRAPPTPTVIPAKAGIQNPLEAAVRSSLWIPAFAGMTEENE